MNQGNHRARNGYHRELTEGMGCFSADGCATQAGFLVFPKEKASRPLFGNARLMKLPGESAMRPDSI